MFARVKCSKCATIGAIASAWNSHHYCMHSMFGHSQHLGILHSITLCTNTRGLVSCWLCSGYAVDGSSAGMEWKTLNAAQKQLRRDMMPLYGTPRALLQLRAGTTLRGHSAFSLFYLQVGIIVASSHTYTHYLTQRLLTLFVHQSGAGHSGLLCHVM